MALLYDGRTLQFRHFRAFGLFPAERWTVWSDISLDDHRDVLVIRLLRGKPTYVHRALWPDLVAVGTSRESWQMDFLPRRERELLEMLDRDGVVRIDEAALALDAYPKDLGRTLEDRVLALGGRESGDGRPTTRTMTSWAHWMKQRRSVRPSKDVAAALARLDAVTAALPIDARLPWWPRSVRKRW